MDSYLVGLVGTGIGPSLSPACTSARPSVLGLRYLYRRLDLDELGLPPERSATCSPPRGSPATTGST